MFHLLPVGQTTNVAFAPDLILCLTLAWVVRRPEYAPALLIAGAALLADLLLSRPPGLWAALVLMLSEYIRSRGNRMKSAGFVWEWFRVSAGIGVIFVANRMAMSMLLLDLPPVPAAFTQYLATVVLYPLIVGLSATLLGVRHRDSTDAETGKQRA